MKKVERYAILLDGSVENVILWDGLSDYDPGPGRELVKIPQEEQSVAEGWVYTEGKKFEPPK